MAASKLPLSNPNPNLSPTQRKALAVAVVAIVAAVSAFTPVPAGIIAAVQALAALFGG